MICIVGCIVGDFDPGVISISVPVTRYSPFERAKKSCGTSMLLFLETLFEICGGKAEV